VGIAQRVFIATECGGFTRIPNARWERAFFKNEPLPEYVGQEFKMIDVALRVHGHRTKQVLRVLPTRLQVLADGRVDVEGHMQLAFRRAGLVSRRPVDPDQQIAKLEADANYFWVLEPGHWQALSRMLGVRARALKTRIYRPPSFSRSSSYR
jgi:hypothetical protein